MEFTLQEKLDLKFQETTLLKMALRDTVISLQSQKCCNEALKEAVKVMTMNISILEDKIRKLENENVTLKAITRG